MLRVGVVHNAQIWWLPASDTTLLPYGTEREVHTIATESEWEASHTYREKKVVRHGKVTLYKQVPGGHASFPTGSNSLTWTPSPNKRSSIVLIESGYIMSQAELEVVTGGAPSNAAVFWLVGFGLFGFVAWAIYTREITKESKSNRILSRKSDVDF